MVNIMRYYALTFIAVVIVFHPNFSYGFCTVDGDGGLPRLSPQEFSEKSDVIFLGKRLRSSVYESPREFEVVEPLKGIDKNIRTIKIFEKGIRMTDTVPMIMRTGFEDLLLVSAVYGKEKRLIETTPPLCKDMPSPDNVITYLKPDYFEKSPFNKIPMALLSVFLVLAVTFIFVKAKISKP